MHIPNPFNRSHDISEPHRLINRIENRLQTALEKRKEARRSLKQDLREAKLARDRAEEQVTVASGEDVEFARDEVEAQEEIIDEYRERIRALNKQITEIRRRFPALRVLRSDVDLMEALDSADADWREDVEQLIGELETDDPTTDATSGIDGLLHAIDDMTDNVRAQTGQTMPEMLRNDVGADTDDVTDDSTITSHDD